MKFKIIAGSKFNEPAQFEYILKPVNFLVRIHKFGEN